MRILLSIIFVIIMSGLEAQNLPDVIVEQIELYFSEEETVQDPFQYYELLENYYNNPMDINEVEYDDLLELGLLSDIQISDLISHRSSLGDFLSVEELQAIPSFAVEDILRVRPFLHVPDTERLPVSWKQMFSNSDRTLFMKWGQTLEDKAGFVENENGETKYLGDRNKLFMRFQSNYEYKFRYGFTIEKDEGEQLTHPNSDLGLDFLTFHAAIKDYNKVIKDVVIGDYAVSMGQGLITHSGFGAGKSAFVNNVRRGGRVIRPYNSVNENGMFRGFAATLAPQDNVKMSILFNNVNRDANVVEDITDPEQPELFVSSLLTLGNHRTEAEVADIDAINLSSIGFVAEYDVKNLSLGVNYLRHELNSVLARSDDAYNLYRFSGSELNNYSVDYSYRFRNLHLFGESAYSSTGGLAHLSGLLLGLHKRMGASVMYRSYDRDYNALNPNAFGESYLVNNERGLYLGVELRPTDRLTISSYMDTWTHPWLRFRASNPSDGKEYLMRVEYRVKRKLSVYVQYRNETKLRNTDLFLAERGSLSTALPIKRENLRIQLSNSSLGALELRTRLEFSRFDDVNEEVRTGSMIFQDIIYRPIEKPYSFTARFALFNTDDYDSRIYAYENSILYEFSIPPLFDRGVRYYINYRHDLSPFLTIEGRLARTYKSNGDIGSGNERVDGDSRTDVKVQLKFSF